MCGCTVHLFVGGIDKSACSHKHSLEHRSETETLNGSMPTHLSLTRVRVCAFSVDFKVMSPVYSVGHPWFRTDLAHTCVQYSISLLNNSVIMFH